jgi:glutamate synthase domain-containing protein 1
MLFLPQDPETAAAAATIVEKVVAAEGRCRIIGWRDVPHDAAVVGRMAKAEQPIIRQVQCHVRVSFWFNTGSRQSQLRYCRRVA